MRSSRHGSGITRTSPPCSTSHSSPGDGTLVRIEQRDTSADYPAGYAAGWYAMLACLSIQLGGREPTETDWDADFAFALRTLG